MTRQDWLNKRHLEIDTLINQLEQERETERSFEHKALLMDLKKEKLKLKDELSSIV